MKSYLYIATSSSSRFKDWQTNCSHQQRLIKSRLWNVHQELFYLERCSLNKGFEKSCIINTIRHIWKNYIATGSVCLEHFYFIFFIIIPWCLQKMLDWGCGLHYSRGKYSSQRSFLREFCQHASTPFGEIHFRRKLKLLASSTVSPDPANLWVHLCQCV